MARNKAKREPIPKHFKSVEEAAEFWDTHDLADYWDLTREAHFDAAHPPAAPGNARGGVGSSTANTHAGDAPR